MEYRFIKKILKLLIILLIGFFLNSCVFINNRKEVKLSRASSDSKFEKIQENFIKKPHEIKQYGAQKAYKLIQKNIKSFEQLKKNIDKAHNISDVLDEVAEELTEIAENYRKVADMAGDIEDHTVSTMGELFSGQSMSEKTVESTQKKIRALEDEMENAQRNLKSEENENEITKLKAIIAGNSSQIHSLEGQIRIWNNFLDFQERLLGALGNNNETVSTLLFVLEKNADVYETAAETAQMTKSAASFIRDLNGLIDINNTLGDLMDSWNEVDIVVNEIISLDFNDL